MMKICACVNHMMVKEYKELIREQAKLALKLMDHLQDAGDDAGLALFNEIVLNMARIMVHG